MQEIKINKEEQLKEEIMAVAQKLFQRYGFQKTTMEDIAKEMRRGKSTIYFIFKSKSDILAAILISASLKANLRVATAVNKVNTAAEKIHAHILTSYDIVSESYVQDEVLRSELYSNTGPAVDYKSFIAGYLKNIDSDKKAEFKDAGERIIEDILIFGVRNNEFSEKILDNLRFTVKVLQISMTSVVLGLVSDSNEVYSDEDKSMMLNTCAQVLIKGLK